MGNRNKYQEEAMMKLLATVTDIRKLRELMWGDPGRSNDWERLIYAISINLSEADRDMSYRLKRINVYLPEYNLSGGNPIALDSTNLAGLRIGDHIEITDPLFRADTELWGYYQLTETPKSVFAVPFGKYTHSDEQGYVGTTEKMIDPEDEIDLPPLSTKTAETANARVWDNSVAFHVSD